MIRVISLNSEGCKSTPVLNKDWLKDEIETYVRETGGLLFDGISFVITGTLQSMKRKEAEEIIKRNGGSVSSAVSSRTGVLLAGESPGSKYRKAEELGVEIWDENAFLKKCGKEDV